MRKQLKIDESKPAPQFKIVSRPDVWEKSSRTRPKVSEKMLAYQEFFQILIDKMRSQGLTNAKKPNNNLGFVFKVNMTEIEKEIKEITERLGFYGGDIELRVIAEVDYQGRIGDEKINKRKEFLLLIKLVDAYYEFSGKPFEETVKKEVVQTIAVLSSNSEKATLIGLPMILFIGILGLAVVKWRYAPLTENDIGEIKREKEYQRFKEEISEGSIMRS